MSDAMNVTEKDTAILRDLARKVAEIAHDPVQQEKAELWRRHNDLEPVRPLVLVFPEGSWRELLHDADLRTETPYARHLEWDLRSRIYYWEHMRDDNVIEPVMACRTVIHDTGWGVSAKRTSSGQATGADHFEPVIREESDIDKIVLPVVTVDRVETERRCQELRRIFDGILRVEERTYAYTCFAMMDEFAQWRGLDQVFLDLVDRPDWIHRAMERLYEGMVRRHEAVMQSGAATLNNRNHGTGSGGTGYTSQLPRAGFDGVHVRSCDLWAMATTQIFSEVSPAMHEEFALQYERKFLARFGLNCYGCCEPLHNKMDIVKTIPNLRRISISPWADVRKCAEALGNQYIFSWKPNPALVASDRWDPQAVRRQIADTLAATRGCVVEMVLKDTHTCRNDPRRIWEWVRIALELAENAG